MWIKSTILWIDDKWTRFEAWVASVTPGIKTKLATALGAIGSLGAVGQEYVTQMPLTKFITAEQIAITSAVLFTLAFWFRGIGDRVALRDIQASPKAPDA